jgi:hypothetical protein
MRGQDELAEEWRHRETGWLQPHRHVPGRDAPSAALGSRFAAAWEARERERAQAFNALRAKHARDVAHLKGETKQRWRMVGLVSHGRVAGALWALHARRANEQAWRRLHEQHRAAVRAAQFGHPPLQWSEWVRSQPESDVARLAESRVSASRPDPQPMQKRAREHNGQVATLGAGQRKGRSR